MEKTGRKPSRTKKPTKEQQLEEELRDYKDRVKAQETARADMDAKLAAVLARVAELERGDGSANENTDEGTAGALAGDNEGSNEDPLSENAHDGDDAPQSTSTERRGPSLAKGKPAKAQRPSKNPTASKNGTAPKANAQDETNTEIPYPESIADVTMREVQKAMDVDDDEYDSISRTIRDLIIRCDLEWQKDMNSMDTEKLASVYKAARKVHPVLRRFERGWATYKFIQQSCQNKRKYAVAKGRLPAKGKGKKKAA